MTVGIMQPYFMPYIGYWQLMSTVDRYVVYDDAHYIKGGWVARNNILMAGQPHMFTITLNGASPNKLFNEITIRDDFNKFRKMLQSCYSRAPYYSAVVDVLERVYTHPERTLGLFMLNSFRVIFDYLNIDKQFVLSSELEIDKGLHGVDKVLALCKVFNADKYINAIGGKALYDKALFAEHGLELKFLTTGDIGYKQFSDQFVPNLSIIDVLMFNSVEQTRLLLNQFTLE